MATRASVPDKPDRLPERAIWDRSLATLAAQMPPEHLERGVRYLLTALEMKAPRLAARLKHELWKEDYLKPL